MKKDIEWLKEELIGDLMRFNGNPSMTDYESGIASGIINAINLTEKLDEPEQTDTNVGLSKPVIPKFVDDWIDAHNLYGNNPLREYRDLEKDFNEGWTDEEDAAIYHWVNKNPYAFIDALRYGYEVEKEKLYTVELPHSYELIKLLHTQNYHIKKYSESGFGDYTNTFTEAEIKKIDERLMAFAEEVKPCN